MASTGFFLVLVFLFPLFTSALLSVPRSAGLLALSVVVAPIIVPIVVPILAGFTVSYMLLPRTEAELGGQSE